MYYYLAQFYVLPKTAKTLKDGYWPIDNQKINVIIDDRKYNDTPDKLVFHMRFFDGSRTPTNRSYMKLVNERSRMNLNVDNEEIFVRQCIARGIYEGLNPFINHKELLNSGELKIKE